MDEKVKNIVVTYEDGTKVLKGATEDLKELFEYHSGKKSTSDFKEMKHGKVTLVEMYGADGYLLDTKEY